MDSVVKRTGTIVLAGGLMVVLACVPAGCEDSAFHGSLPRIDVFHVGPSPSPPGADELQTIPDTDTITIDFGQVDIETVSKRYLIVPNTGTGDLLLSAVDIRPASSEDFLLACLQGGAFEAGCPVDPGAPLTTGPGQQLVVEITYAPSDEGPDQGGFTLVFNTTEHHSLVVELTGEGVTQEIQVCISDCTGDQADDACRQAPDLCNDQVGKDSLLVEFGDTAMNATCSRELVIRNQGKRDLQIQEIGLYGGDTEQFALDLGGNQLPGTMPYGDQAVVLVEHRPDIGGEHISSVRIGSTDINEPEIEVLLSGRGVAPRVCPDPMEIDFGNVMTGQAVTRSFTLTSCGLLELELIDLAISSGSSPDFSLVDPPVLPASLPVGDSLEIEVQYLPQTSGSDHGGVDIFSDDMASDPVTHLTGAVSLRGNSTPQVCDLQVDPFAVNFGVVEIGDTPVMDVVVSNVGNGPCLLDSAVISTNSGADEFSLPQAPPPGTTFDPAETVQLTVGYQPADRGQDVGVLSLFANDKDTDEVRVDLNAFGIFPGGEGPIAVCSADPVSLVPGQTVTWYGDQSYDTNNRALTGYQWTVVSFPAGSAAAIQGTGANRTTLVDLAGDYTAQLVVTNDIGQQSAPCTATVTATPTEDLWVEMYWTHPGDDMDLHLLEPGGTPETSGDCYYANCTGWFPPDWGVSGYDGDDPHLDLDDIPGTGPENINIANPADGLYTVFVNDFPGSTYTDPNPVTVNVYIDGALIDTFTNAISGEDHNWYVCTIDWPSGTVTPL